MPEMGRPVSARERAFQEIGMGPRNQNSLAGGREISDTEKERLLNKITGFKPKTVFDKEDKTKMDKDGFLKLLTHQLQNQDPMKPMDQGKLSSELAQFSQLEQLSNLNSKFDKLGRNAQVEDQFYGASFLGKEVVTSGSSMKIKEDGGEGDILFNLDKNASKVLVRIYDSKNNMVGEIWKENIGHGNQTVTWDGVQLDGSPSIKGDYHVDVKAWDYQAEPVTVSTKATGVVESVFFENGETVLLVGGKKVYLRDVDSFHMPGTRLAQSANVAGPKAGAKTTAENLPIAPIENSEVNFRQKPDIKSSIRAYNDHEPTTGITDVYDVE